MFGWLKASRSRASCSVSFFSFSDIRPMSIIFMTHMFESVTRRTKKALPKEPSPRSLTF